MTWRLSIREMISSKKVNVWIKSSILYTVSTILGQGISFLGIIVFTRLMGQTEYGNYSTYYAYVSILTVLIGANLYYALNNAYIDKRNEIHEFRKAVLSLSVIVMLIISITILLLFRIIAHEFSIFITIMAIMHAYSFFVVNYRIYSANMENDIGKKIFLLILPNALQFVLSLMFIMVLSSSSYDARIIGSALGVAIVAFVSFIEIIRCDGKLINIDYWKYALSIALPTVAMSISYMLLQQCDRVMIKIICGPDETAVYSVIYYLGYAIIAIDQAAAPVRQAWIFKRLDKGYILNIKTFQGWYLLIMGAIAIMIMLSGPELIRVLAPESYWRFEFITPFVLSACMMLLYRFFVDIILFYKKNISLSVGVMISALVNIGLNAIFLPMFGAVAACYTTVVSYGLLFIITAILASKNISGVYSMTYFMLFIVGLFCAAIIFRLTYKSFAIRYLILSLFICIFVVGAICTRNKWKVFWGGEA